MSWFKEKVEDWDLVGKALHREIDSAFAQVTKVQDEDEVEDEEGIDLEKLKEREEMRAELERRFYDSIKKLCDGE